MKPITEPVTKNDRNAWGGYSAVTHQQFEIEECDVGKVRPDYLGQGHMSVQLTKDSVGAVIEVLTDGKGWTCWSFISQPKKGE